MPAWLFAGCGQGPCVFFAILFSVRDFSQSRFAVGLHAWMPAAAVGLFCLGMIPLLQIYQHREDAKRGCETISRQLGVLATFYLAGFFMAMGALLYYLYLSLRFGKVPALLFLIINLPAAAYFIGWYSAVRKDERRADFGHVMRMCLFAATGLNLFLLGMLLVLKS